MAVGLDARRLPRPAARERRVAGWLARPLLYVVGYGPLLCAITAAAYFEELRRAEMALGEDREDRRGGGSGVSDDFDAELAADERFERRLFWRQLAIVVLVAILIASCRGGELTVSAHEASLRTRVAFALAVIAGLLSALLPGPELDPLVFGLACAFTLALLAVGALPSVRASQGRPAVARARLSRDHRADARGRPRARPPASPRS